MVKPDVSSLQRELHAYVSRYGEFEQADQAWRQSSERYRVLEDVKLGEWEGVDAVNLMPDVSVLARARQRNRDEACELLRRSRDLSFKVGGPVYQRLANILDVLAIQLESRQNPVDLPSRGEPPAMMGRRNPKTGKVRKKRLSQKAKAVLSKQPRDEYDWDAWYRQFPFLAEVQRVLRNLHGSEQALRVILDQFGPLKFGQHVTTHRDETDLPPLSAKAAAVYEILLEIPAHRCMTGRELVDALAERDIDADQSTLTSHIIPQLKRYGIENSPRIGYRIPSSRRPPP